jgi:uncharacterized protein (DUF2235 family)/membrane protease YdiL (CAAX protease family)
MARKLVVLLDGTGNQIGANLSNVLKFYRTLDRDEDQLVYYDPGVGTIGTPGWWSQLKLRFQEVLGLALGFGLDDNVLDAYSWLCSNWREGDCIYLLGFSRGAYTARVVAGFIHMCGLLRPDQLNLAGYALIAYKRSADTGDLEIGFNFRRVAGSRRPRIRFLGVWDTVSTVIVPRPDRFYLPSLQTLPFTRSNPSVETFRHAIAMDERRRMFRLNHWKDEKGSIPDPETGTVRTKQTWFAGVHSDVGGGYPEAQSALSKYPLLWMIRQAQDLPEGEALRFDSRLVNWLARGDRPDNGDPKYPYVAPDPKGELHKSLTGAWWLFEFLPKSARLKEWPGRLSLLGLYIPWAEPRPIPNRPWKGVRSDERFAIHSSAVARIAEVGGYRPVNLPAEFAIDTTEGPAPPPIPVPPYRPEGAFARVKRLLSTWPDVNGWARLGKTALWLVPALLLLGWMGGFVGWDPKLSTKLALLAAIAFFVPVLAEESVFRGLLLKPPSDGASGLGPAILSALLFASYNLLGALLCRSLLGDRCPPWADLGFNPWFLASTFALGLACARLALATRSIWPGAILHWTVLAAWLALFAGPDLVGT